MNNLKTTLPAILSLLFLAQAPLLAEKEPPDWEALEQRHEELKEERLKWWREAKFGMFIHWGIYAIYGEERGQEFGYGEHILADRKIPIAEYRETAKSFNPVNYDPDAWAQLAKDAGMRYVIITSKHHDGFALWDSAVTDWDVVDATAWGKDLLAPLAEAVRERDLQFGLYFSQCQDWVHPGGHKKGRPEDGGWDEAHIGNFDEFLAQISVPQVQEIIDNYDPAVIWWDTPWIMNPERAEPFKKILFQHPEILTNPRLGGFQGDTRSSEQHIPTFEAALDTKGPWEVCMTMNMSWGYSAGSTRWKDTTTLLRMLADIASKGGNFLLNVGPKADGTIPEESAKPLREIGQWMDVYGEAIYGTTGSPFGLLPWGRVTQKQTDEGTKLYLLVFHWPENGQLLLPNIRNEVTAKLLPGGDTLETIREGDDLRISGLPADAPHPIISVIQLDVSGSLDADRYLPEIGSDESLTLPAELADIHNQGHGPRIERREAHGRRYLDWESGWNVHVDWAIAPLEAGQYELLGEIATENAAEGHVILGQPDGGKLEGEEQPIQVPATGASDEFATVSLGKVQVPAVQDGPLLIRMEGEMKTWGPLKLRSITLKKSVD